MATSRRRLLQSVPHLVLAYGLPLGWWRVPSVALVPTSVPRPAKGAFAMVDAAGSGFAPGSRVVVWPDGKPVYPNLRHRVDATGRFSVGAFRVESTTSVGGHDVEIRDDTGKALLASAAFTVTPAPPDPPLPPSTDWAKAIAGAQPGAVLDFTGTNYAGNLVLTKPVTIRGGTLTASAGKLGIEVKSADVNIEGVNVLGKDTAYSGIWGSKSDGLRVLDCQLVGFTYAGILVLGQQSGTLRGNTIQRVGVVNPVKPNYNAYGIAVTMSAGGPPSREVLVTDNTVTDVPYWHAFDTHGGERIVFTANISRRAPRAFFITSNQASERASDCRVMDNQCLEAAPLKSGGTNPVAITTYDTRDCEITGNSISRTYPAAVYDYADLSQDLTVGINSWVTP